jgi:hypothetical protein
MFADMQHPHILQFIPHVDGELLRGPAHILTVARHSPERRRVRVHRHLVALGREKRFVVMSGSDTRLPEVFALGVAAIGGS